MFETHIFLFIAVVLVIFALAILMLSLAAKYDKETVIRGVMMTESEILAKIKEKREELADINEKLRRLEEIDSNRAKTETEVQELQNRKEELLAEWNMLEERKNEVREIRLETEQAVQENQNVVSELTINKSELENVKEQLAKADNLAERIEHLETERERLDKEISELDEQRRLLEGAEARVADLKSKELEIETQLAEKSGQVNAKESQLIEIESKIETQGTKLNEVGNEFTEKLIDLKNVKTEIEEKKHEHTAITEEVDQLKIKKTMLEEETSQTGGKDPLALLKVQPEVIIQLDDWPESSIESEEEALERVQESIKLRGLYYNDRVIRAFHTSMKVNDKTQLTVLAGISGTGKSQLPRQYAAGMGIGFLQVPVQPRWDSPQDLMGFYNYIEKQFRPTDMARALWAVDGINNPVDALKDRMLLILFDEMNLARVEYYFSDFLSRLESRPPKNKVGNVNERKDSEIELEISNMKNPQRIFPNFNVFFAGTMNEDESTQSLSDKVVDRSNVMRFHAPNKTVLKKAEDDSQVNAQNGNNEAMKYSTWDSWLIKKIDTSSEKYQQVVEAADKLSEIMKSFHRPFGYRLGDAITTYVMNYPEGSVDDPVKCAIADQIEMRLLPKLRGVDVSSTDLESQFNELKDYVEKELQDEALVEAIQESCKNSETTGQFVWGGVLRS